MKEVETDPLEDISPRWLRRHLAAGVVAISTRIDDGTYRAFTATSVTSVSIDPPLFLVSVELDSQMDTWLEESGAFALSVLTRAQQFFADQFAGFAPLHDRQFRGIPHRMVATGAPILQQAIAWADCTVEHSLTTGDHRCFIGRAQAWGQGEGDSGAPLIYYGGRYLRTE